MAHGACGEPFGVHEVGLPCSVHCDVARTSTLSFVPVNGTTISGAPWVSRCTFSPWYSTEVTLELSTVVAARGSQPYLSRNWAFCAPSGPARASMLRPNHITGLSVERTSSRKAWGSGTRWSAPMYTAAS